MRKLFSILAATLFAGSMFATDVTVDLSKGKYENSAITWTAADGNITIQQIKGVGAAINSNYINAPRVYKGNVLAFKCEENYTITGIELTCNSTYYGGSMTAGTTIKGDTLVVDDATNILRTWASTSGGTHVVSTKNTDGESTIYIQNGPSSSTQLRFTALKISYIKAASTTPTISAGNVEFGTVISGKAEAATLNVTGENLTTAITYSLESGANFSVTGTLTTAGGSLTVNVTNTAEGVYQDVLTLISGTDATKQVTITATVVELSGEGTKENPYTCEDVLKLNNAISDKAWVIGYILGGAKTAGSPSALAVDALTGENTAIAIADNANETDNTKMVSVQLGQSVRADVAATTSKGRKIQVQGTLESYLTVPGVKGVNAAANYEFVDTPPTPGVIEITNSDDTYYGDYVDDEGYWIFEVETSTYYLTLSNLDLTITQAAGTYTAAELDPEYTYLLTETDSIWFVDGSITLAVSGETTTIKGDLVGKDGNTYRLDLSCAPNPYRYDEDVNYAATFDSYEIDDTDFDDSGVITIQASQDGKGVMIGMFLPATATEAVPVAGTYPINDTNQPQTVAAGYFDETEGLIPSIAALISGTSATNIWYLVSGTVTVNEYKTLTVVAKNSKNRDIAITLKGEDEPTSIANTKAANLKRKAIKNGHLFINANNVEYNVNGARVK